MFESAIGFHLESKTGSPDILKVRYSEPTPEIHFSSWEIESKVYFDILKEICDTFDFDRASESI